MVLLVPVLAGIALGWGYARWQGETWHPPAFYSIWLVIVGFLPQLLLIYLPFVRQRFPDRFASFSLIFSQSLLLVFTIVNRRLPGMYLLMLGLGCNLLAILSNGGFMPLSVETASRLWADHELAALDVGKRIHSGSKDILLWGDQIIFPWLADRFVSPNFIPVRFAYSLGDIFISLGAFYLMLKGAAPAALSE